MERAEEAAAYSTLNEDSESCNLCFFRFDDPVKKDKVITRCTIWDVKVHEPCLVKSGCDCEFFKTKFKNVAFYFISLYRSRVRLIGITGDY